MIASVFHPATIQLLWLQSRGRSRRMWRRFRQPRRLVLSVVAGVMAVVCLGNAAMTIWFREKASPETLRAMLSLGLLLYAVWHFAKAAFFRPKSPFDWTPGESELLAATPLGPRDLVAYQLASVTVTTIVKAGLFTLLLLPDLRCLPMGLIGLMLAMMLLEMLRMAIEIATWGMGRSAYMAYRVAVVAGLMAGGIAIAAAVVRGGAFAGQIDIDEGFLHRLVEILVHLNNSTIGYAALPFRPFVELILADRLTLANAGLTVGTSAIVLSLAAAVIGLYTTISRRVAQREKRDYGTKTATHDWLTSFSANKLGPDFGEEFKFRLWRIPRWGGAGPLVWRQLIGARRHWGSLLTAMIAPAVLAFVPGSMIEDRHAAFLATTGTLAFYTFLLLPTALRFDFRRDLDRLATLKGLPIKPGAAVVGQTVAPVLIATVFQTAVLAFAAAARSLPPHLVVMAMLIMIPLNVLVFGLDNLIYLLYPYRMQQEGLEIFLRMMLTFTGKGLLFAIGMAATAGWGFAAATVTHRISQSTGIAINTYNVFMAGMIAGPIVSAALVLFFLCRTYRNMNPIEDIPR